MYSEALDVRMIRGDLAIHTLTSDSIISDAIMQMDQGLSREALGRFAKADSFIGSTLREMCEVLEALGRFEEAARVYKEIASSWYKDNDAYDKCQLCHYAGTAYTRSEDLVDAEEQFIAALHWSSRSQPASQWDLSEFTTTRVIDYFLGILYAKPAALLQKDDEKVEAAFTGLLFAAGYQPDSERPATRDMFLDSGPDCLQMLKAKLQTRKRAMRVLVEATERPSAANFRRVLRTSLTPPAARVVASIRQQGLFNPATEEKQAFDLRMARITVQPKKVLNTCFNCGNELAGDVNLQCTCRQAVFYCNESCQRAHWKIHKRDCRIYLDKKKAKQAKQDGKAPKSK